MGKEIQLPEPKTQSQVSVEEAISKRRSRREYSKGALTLAEVSQLLWAAQGITADNGHRAAPSAGATYPLETYLAAGEVENLETGLYHYKPQSNSLIMIKNEDLRKELCKAAWDQRLLRLQ